MRRLDIICSMFLQEPLKHEYKRWMTVWRKKSYDLFLWYCLINLQPQREEIENTFFKTTLCRLFIFRFVRPKQLSTRKKKRGEKMKCESQHRIKNKSWVLWSLVSVENINFRVLWQFWFNLRRHATYSGAEYMVLLQLSFILHLMMEILEANSQPNWESSFSHFTFQQQHKKYRFA